MKTNIMKGRQILGSFFAIMIVLFSITNSYAEAKGKITEPEQQSFSSLSGGRISPEDGNSHREDLITQHDLCASIYNGSVSDSKNAGRVNVRAFQINSLIQNGCFLLPGIHAP